MKQLMHFASIYLASVPGNIRRRKWTTLLVFILLTAAIVSGIPKLQFDFTVESWFDPKDPTFIAYNELHDQFGSEDGVLIVYKAKDGDVFSEQSLKTVKAIRDELLNFWSTLKEGETSALEHIVEVNTLINASVLSVDGDLLRSSPLVGDTVPSSKEALEKIRQEAEKQRNFELQYYSSDMQYGAINIKTDFGAIPLDENETPIAIDADSLKELDLDLNSAIEDDSTGKPLRFKSTSMTDYVALNQAIKAIIEKPEYQQHFEYYRVGNTVDSENQVKMGEEMGQLYMLALLIMVIMLFLLFRSLAGVIWPMAIIIFSVLWTLGIAGHLGLSASPFIVFTILLLLTAGMADAVHVISGYLYYRNQNEDHVTALESAYKKNGVACFMTSLTTMVGLISLALSGLMPVKNFAYTSTIGIGIAFLLTIYVLPMLLEFWTPVPKTNPKKGLGRRLIPDPVPFIQRMLDKVIPAIEKNPVAYVVPFFLVFGLCIYGAFQTRVDYSLTDAYREDSNFFQSVQIIDEKMAGANRIALYLDMGTDNGLQDPQVLNTIDKLLQDLTAKYSDYIVTTSSIIDVVKDANQKLHDGNESMYRIPDTAEQLSQTLFMFNIADPEERAGMVDETYRKGNITITLKNYGSHEYNPVFESMRADINAAMASIKQDYPEAKLSITGIFAMGMQAADYIIITQMESFGITLLMISLIMLVIFSSFKAGLISLIPNLIPAFLTLGILGLMNVPLDFYTMMLAPVVIGISVDDTIHFISHYRQEVIKDGNISRALRHTISECGQAVLFTSLILGLGFGIMSIATTPGIANLGKFGFLSVMAGLFNDLFLTPALILIFKMKFQTESQPEKDAMPNTVAVQEPT